MLVRAKHWITVNGVWIQPKTEFEVDAELASRMSADVDIIQLDKPVNAGISETAVKEADTADPVQQPVKRSGRSRKKTT